MTFIVAGFISMLLTAAHYRFFGDKLARFFGYIFSVFCTPLIFFIAVVITMFLFNSERWQVNKLPLVFIGLFIAYIPLFIYLFGSYFGN